jgi:hypothetical protein
LSLVGDVLEDLQHLPISVNDTPGFTDKYIDKIETLIPFIAQARVPEGWNVLNNPAFLPPSEDTAVHDWCVSASENCFLVLTRKFAGFICSLLLSPLTPSTIPSRWNTSGVSNAPFALSLPTFFLIVST